MKKLLIFDAYGTLISTGNGSVKAAERILALQDRVIDASAFYKEWKKLHRRHIDEAISGGFIPECEIFAEDLRVLYERYGIKRPYIQDVQIMLDSLENRKIFAEVKDAVEELRRQYRVVIGSTTDTAPLLGNLRSNRLDVDAVYTSEMLRRYKPDPAFYRQILQCEGCEPEDAVFIGDSLQDDVAGPAAVGITTIWVNRKNQDSPPQAADYTVTDIGEIAALDL